MARNSYSKKFMDPACSQEISPSGAASVMAWGTYKFRDIGALIRLVTTLTSGRYVSILFDYLNLFMSIVHFDIFGQFQQDDATPHTSRFATAWLQHVPLHFRLYTSIDIPNPQTGTLWNIFGISWNLLFRRHRNHFALLWIFILP